MIIARTVPAGTPEMPVPEGTGLWLRSGTPQDVAEIGEILREWVDETPWFPNLHDRAADDAFLQNLIETRVVTVARADCVTLGFIAHDGAFISCLYVASAERRRGIGRVLLDSAKTQATGTLKLWTFQANLRARAFYAREGFVETARTPGNNEEQLPDVELTWTQKGTHP